MEKRTDKLKNPKISQHLRMAYAVGILMIPFSIAMYLIFRSGNFQSNVEGTEGINLSMPEAFAENIAATKQTAIEKMITQTERTSKVASLDDDPFGVNFDDTNLRSGESIHIPGDNSLQEIKAQISGYYSAPVYDPQIAALKNEVDRLNRQMETQSQYSVPEPDEILRQNISMFDILKEEVHPEDEPITATVTKENKGKISYLGYVKDTVNHTGTFHTPVGGHHRKLRNSIQACVDGQQSITVGGSLRIRLLETIKVDDYHIPGNTVLNGTTRLNGQRLAVDITSVECQGNIIPVKLSVFDIDGQPGLYIPEARENTAINDAAAAVAGSLGSGITITQSAGQQVAMDAARGAISGTTQYASSKLKEIRITVQDNYRVMLIQNQTP